MGFTDDLAEGHEIGLFFAQRSSDRRFSNELENLKRRLKEAKDKGDIEHPLQLGMIGLTNALMDEIKAIDEGKIKPEERRLSGYLNGRERTRVFQTEANKAMLKLSGGELELEFKPPESFPEHVRPLQMASTDNAKIVKAKSKRPRP